MKHMRIAAMLIAVASATASSFATTYTWNGEPVQKAT